MKLSFLLLLSLLFGLVACTSFDNYVKTQKSQYLYSQNLGPLKTPKDLKIGSSPYTIPAMRSAKQTQLPDLYPPSD